MSTAQPEPTRPPCDWTIAYRNPRANHLHRVTDWSGTWAEAVDQADRFLRANPHMQVWYVADRAAELRGYVCADDIGNVLTERGTRVPMVDNGTIGYRQCACGGRRGVWTDDQTWTCMRCGDEWTDPSGHDEPAEPPAGVVEFSRDYITITPDPEVRAAILAAAELPDLAPRRDWSTMHRRDFDTAAPPDVQPALFPVPDPAGTADLGELPGVLDYARQLDVTAEEWARLADRQDALGELAAKMADELADELPALLPGMDVSGPGELRDLIMWEAALAELPTTCPVCRVLLVRFDGSTGCKCDGSVQ